MESVLTDYLQKSDILFSISNFTKAQIDEFLPAHPTPVQAIQLAVKSSQIKKAREHRDSNIFYFPSVSSPQKNHIGLLRAAKELAAKNVNFQLVLTGYLTELLVSDKPTPYPHIEQCRNFYWNHKDLWGRVQALGLCDYTKVEELYATCCAVIFPSKYEGFGLPVLEALAYQAPVICSSIPPVVEQLQFYDCLNAVSLFDPLDSSALACCMEDALAGKLKVKLSANDVAQKLAKWNWSDVATAYVEQLQRHTKKH
jgi:glycosyltransferase involved in cell wall biosynthesis